MGIKKRPRPKKTPAKFDSLRFSPDILRRLGEELTPSIDQCIAEVVRNSYDADARDCHVELLNIGQENALVRITDNGIGMTKEDIRKGWLVIGRSRKGGVTKTPELHRHPVGDKGLGRLSALRLGTKAVVETRPSHDRGLAHRVSINWNQFDEAETVESIPVTIETFTTVAAPGTTVEITGLRHMPDREEMHRLSRALLLLSDPFHNKLGFNVNLQIPDFPDVEQEFKDSYFTVADYHLEAELCDDGTVKAVLQDQRGVVLFQADADSGLKPPYFAPSAKFALWEFNLTARAFVKKAVPLSVIKDWLGEYGGLYLYHHGLRVQPYGDLGHDWLQMDLARVRNPEKRPSTNNSTGYISVADTSERLVAKTDRSGLIDNLAFRELRRFANDVLDWTTRERLKERDNNRKKKLADAREQVNSAQKAVAQAVRTLPAENRSAIQEALTTLERARNQEVRSLQEEVQLYRALATVGTTASVFAHETPNAVTRLGKAASTIRSLTASASQGTMFQEEDLNSIADLIDKSSDALSGFGGLLINLLVRDKRHNGPVDVNRVLQDLVKHFHPFLQSSSITLRVEMDTELPPVVFGSESALESIIANLVTNATHALIYGEPKCADPLMVLRTRSVGDKVILQCLDNGPGIVAIPLQDIWVPGRSSRQRGTGLGLTIVRDSAADLGGSAQAISNGELGGAEFIVYLPLRGSSR